jgi:hypothetical protein
MPSEPDDQHRRDEFWANWERELAILDGLQDELWHRATSGHGEVAVDLWIRASRVKAKLLGLLDAEEAG